MKNRSTSPETARFQNKDTVRLLRSLHEFVIAGSGLMLVYGPQGSGKSELLDQFVQNAAQQWRICRLSATGNSDARILQARIASCFDLRHFEIEGRDPAEQLLGRFADIERSMIPILTIDDAERLGDEALEWLGCLLDQAQPVSTGPRIVLFGDQTTDQRLAGAGIKFQHLAIQPLDLHGISDFLSHLLDLSGHPNTFPFSQRQLRRIEKESGGWPGRIQVVAQELLAIEGQGGRGRSLMVLLMLAVLLLGLITFRFFKTNDDVPVATTIAQKTHIIASKEKPPPQSLNSDKTDESTSAQTAVSVADTTPTVVTPVEEESTGSSPAAEHNTPLPLGEALNSAAEQTLHIEGVDWIKRQPRANYTLQVMVASTPATLIELAKGGADATSPMAVASFTQDGRSLSLLLYRSYASRSEAESAAAQVEASFRMRPWIRSFASLPQLTDIGSAPVVASAPSATSTSSVTLAGAAWLWSRNPSHYTIQLLGDGQKSTLHNFVERLHPTGPLAMVRVARDGKAWHLLLAGEYESTAAATAAIAALPDELKSSAPWPRQFSAVQDQMAALSQ